jgi:glyoxylase-like metal-dependent hydrolase (beta-lactamase superfamily II)
VSIYLKQLEIGPMANYVYLIGDSETREAMVVDPAWDIDGILDLLDRDDMKLVGALVTHFHPDHIGGNLFGQDIPGVTGLLEKRPVKVYMHKDEVPYVKRTLGMESSDFTPVDGETTVDIGNIPVRMIHTPGHTPGSLCFMVDGNLVSGDTLFIGSCGRVDLPGSNPEDLYRSLTGKLKKLPAETVVYPGHNYAADRTSTIGREASSNPFMRFDSVEQFLAMMGYGG